MTATTPSRGVARFARRGDDCSSSILGSARATCTHGEKAVHARQC